MPSFLPFKKLRRKAKCCLLAALLSFAVLVGYLQLAPPPFHWAPWMDGGAPRRHGAGPDNYSEAVMDGSHSQETPPWKPEYLGQANLHVFEDWCGSSTDHLRRNPHYPLYPHSRTTVQKLAVAPSWTDYGLRIFGYLHPYVDGEYLFAVASDDGSEFWLSRDHTPIQSQPVALVGKAGLEWTAPGEFGKYASQVSQPVRLRAKERYFFEILHKQNDRGTDHVEVAWRLSQAGWSFKVIDSKYISLYTNESALKMNEVGHIPLSPASHPRPPSPAPPGHLGIDMLQEDPRDSLYQMPLVDEELLQSVLPSCSYNPSYLIRGFALQRYQGLEFIHMTYVYPNDYTRLTHMESDNKCFYNHTQDYLDRSGFSKYMKIDEPEWDALEGGPQRHKRHVAELGVSEQTQSKREPDAPGKMDLEDSPVTISKEPRDRAVSLLGYGNSFRWKQSSSLLTPIPWLPLVVLGTGGEPGDDYMHRDTNLLDVLDRKVNWQRTFDVKQLDLSMLRSDRIDLGCNVSGNLPLPSEDALHVVEAFMEKVNQKNQGQFSLLRVMNVEKRLDGAQGSRYLLELEVRDRGGAKLRLSRYVYLLQDGSTPQVDGGAPSTSKPLLCHPLGLSWNPAATVHFVIPVKNQARWVQRFIEDMEKLFRATQDKNFNIIISDFSSTDMDVERALKGSALPRYQYMKLTGNFERSAGLQAGINMIADEHSIVFLCDLHIHFPSSIIDSIRKHCVEGKMAFAPVVMRLDCGATSAEPRGFWEINGFGLLGIYKSDLDAAGGMNTQEFRDRWGGEDWELLDRILQAGLEVERIYLRHFLHYYHSKRGMWNRQII